jgi:hypothetical protein
MACAVVARTTCNLIISSLSQSGEAIVLTILSWLAARTICTWPSCTLVKSTCKDTCTTDTSDCAKIMFYLLSSVSPCVLCGGIINDFFYHRGRRGTQRCIFTQSDVRLSSTCFNLRGSASLLCRSCSNASQLCRAHLAGGMTLPFCESYRADHSTDMGKTHCVTHRCFLRKRGVAGRLLARPESRHTTSSP